MCGFLFSNISKIKKEDFLTALNLMHHRGPDKPLNFHQIKDNKFGHNRLIILDESDAATQPFFSRSGRYVMVYNGEIYNYQELAKEYNIHLKTHCDTELLVELYEKIGESCLSKLNGMFAFVIYDTIEDKFFAARDRLGVKPLYYHQNGNQFIISSEIAPIISLIDNHQIDDFALRQYKKMRAVFNGKTLFKSIKILEGGHFIKNNQIGKYWELPLFPKPAPTTEELRDLLISAVKYRMISDVSLGSYLSGGLDSSIISKIIADHIKEDFHSWTIGFKDNNEFEYSSFVSKEINCFHHQILIDREEFLTLAKEMIKIKKEPLSVPNEVLIYKMSKEAKKYNTVLLSGEGADELFFGYDRIFAWANENNFDLKQFSQLYSYGSNEDLEVVEEAIVPFKSKYKRNIDIISAFFQINHLHNLLRRVDSSSMLASIEARTPFVDYRLVERMAGVAYMDKTNKNNPKELLKKVCLNQLPDEIIYRKKVGFPVDVNQILSSDYGNSGYDKWLNFNLEIFNNL